jgi:predicted RNase H-like nuclease
MTKVAGEDHAMASLVAGVDGCPGGWACVILGPESGAASFGLHAGFADLVASLPPDAVIAVDMPIGLPDVVGPGGRGPEAALRPFLGARQSSVFSVPSRRAVYAGDFGSACAEAQGTSDPPRKVSKQCFFLFPKIRELDGLLRGDEELARRVHECHPEGVFMVLNGMRPLAEPKKVKSQPWGPGLDERRTLLRRAGFDGAFLSARPPRGCGLDDLLDACACAAAARRIAGGEALSFPESPVRDGFGLAMAIRA